MTQSTVWIWTLFLVLLQDDSAMANIALSSCNKKWRLLQEEKKEKEKNYYTVNTTSGVRKHLHIQYTDTKLAKNSE